MSEISIDDFQKLDLRVAQVTGAEEVSGSDKLIKIKVDIGGEERQLVAGIKKLYSPSELIGKKIIVLVNLKPVRIFGIESQGMLLAAENNGRISILTLDRELETGSKIK